VLVSAAMVLAFRKVDDGEASLWGAVIIGAAVGFVSGLTGVGGGVFLAPILIAMHWASPRQTAALSSPFIWANSVVGLAGATYVGQRPPAPGSRAIDLSRADVATLKMFCLAFRRNATNESQQTRMRKS
jgi:uncharacterized membrane protein YfcA